MADNDDAVSARSAGDATAVGIAMNADPRAANDAQAYLREQTDLARLQKQSLVEQNAFELSHLRFRRFSDFAKFALEISGILVVLLIVCGIGTMVWKATQDHDLVVDAFSVPADIAQTGMTGSVLAERVLDRLGQMQADTASLTQGAGSYRSNGADQVRVEIPNTGISIGEVDHYLREWLGHETRVGGDLVHTPQGLALTVRYGNQPGSTVEGGEMNRLIESAAERLYGAARPLRFADYLADVGRYREAEAILVPLASKGDTRERAQAYLSLATLRFKQGDVYAQMRMGELATELDPANAAAWYELDGGAYNVSHRETALKAEAMVLSLIKAGKASDLDPDTTATLPMTLAADLAIDTGDAQGAMAACQGGTGEAGGLDDCGTVFLSGYAAEDHDIAEARRLAALLPSDGSDGHPNAAALSARADIASASEDWVAALTLTTRLSEILAKRPNSLWRLNVRWWPNLAYDMARNGQFADAYALIAKTSLDCDYCVMARGKIAAAKRDWAAAAYWFSHASNRMPSLPYADVAWGEMLLHKGDFDAAISKFESAHRKGLHFADPLEMWGETLMQKNRSDLALAKFEEADKYAPNWGRLHLEWGKALIYTGKAPDARKQFEIARGLDLSASDRAALVKWTSAHE